MKDMLQKFKTDFLFTDEEKFIGCNARGTSWQAVRQTLTNESYAIYAHVGKERSPDTFYEYHIIAVAKYGEENIRFFNSKTLQRMFTPEELDNLKELGGGTFLSFEQVVNDMMLALKAESADSGTLYPLPDSVEDEEEDFYDCDMLEHLLNPEHKPDTEVLKLALQDLDVVECDGYTRILHESYGWFLEMSLRWLASVTDRNYPHFDMKYEWDSFLKTLESMAQDALADPDSDIKKYVDMQKAVRGHEVVKIDFECTDGSIESLDVYARAFEAGTVSLCVDGPVIDLDADYAGAPADLDAVSHKLTSVEYTDYEEAEHWIGQEDIVAIRDGEKTLWPLVGSVKKNWVFDKSCGCPKKSGHCLERRQLRQPNR